LAKSSPGRFSGHERGTWQYDGAVILILVFVLLTPRNWFHENRKAERRSHPDRSIISKEETGRIRVDARILALNKARAQNDLHTALQEALPDCITGIFRSPISNRCAMTGYGDCLPVEFTISAVF